MRARAAPPARTVGFSRCSSPVIHTSSIWSRSSSISACAFALGPARIFQLAQQEIDLAVFLQHGDALRLGRVGGDHRADAQAREQLLDLLRLDAGSLAASASTCANVPRRFFAAALALDLAAAAHGRVLLGDGEKLEPDALRLERAGQQLGREIGNGCAAFEQTARSQADAAHHVEKQAEQQLGGFARRCAR